jgi:flagellar biogenesis protein FliO
MPMTISLAAPPAPHFALRCATALAVTLMLAWALIRLEAAVNPAFSQAETLEILAAIP